MSISARTFQSAGQISQHYIPGMYSRIDSVKGASGFVSTNRGVIMGQCGGGDPDVLLAFTSPSDAINTLRSGALMEAVRQALNPSPDYTPSVIYAMRVNSAVQAGLVVDSSTNPMIQLKSSDYGLWNNQITVTIAAGTTSGKKVTIGYQSNSEVFDNIIRPSLTITHATATGTVTNNSSAQTLALSVGTISIDLNSYPTIGDLVAYINAQAGYTAVATSGQETASSLLLDGTTAESLTAGVVFYSNMQAIIDTLNAGSQYVTAAADNGSVNRAAPDNLSLTYLSGGSDGTYQSTDWTAALTALEAEDVQFISSPDATGAVHSSIQAHCDTMSNVVNRKERQFLVGEAWGALSSTAVTDAQGLNSKNGMLVFNGYKQYNASGVVTNFDASYAACLLMGIKCAAAINMPLTSKTLNVLSLENKLSNTMLNTLIQNGVAPVNYNSQGLPVCIRQVNTYQTDDLLWNEFSMVTEAYFANRDLRTYLEGLFLGQPGNIGAGVIKGAVTSRLQQYVDLGIFSTDSNNVSFWAVTVAVSGDTAVIDYDAYITAPLNFGFITSHFNLPVSAAA